MPPTEVAALLTRYLLERGRPAVLVPLALLLTAASWLATPAAIVTPSVDTRMLIATAAQALLLVLALRVWDDLEDRGRDAREHPERVMVRAAQRAPFIGLAVVLAIGALVPIALAGDALRRLAPLAIVTALLALWYRWRPRELDTAPSLLAGHVVLIKYPAIALAIAPPLLSHPAPTPVWRVAGVLASLYLLLCIYEHFDDPALRASRAARVVAIAELIALVPLATVTASLLGMSLLGMRVS